MKRILALLIFSAAACSRAVKLPPTKNYALSSKEPTLAVRQIPNAGPAAQPMAPGVEPAAEPLPQPIKEPILIPLPEPKKERPFLITIVVTNVVVASTASAPAPAAKGAYNPRGIVYAARAGDTATVRRYLAMGADVNARDGANYGATALIAAVAGRHVETAEALLEAQADVRLTAKVNGVEEITALMVAAQGGPLALAQMLVKAGADVNASTRGSGSGSTALMAAAAAGNADIVRYFLYEGADANARNVAGRTALMMAAQNGRIPCVEALLKVQGLSINAKDRQGLSALGLARQSRQREIEALLLRYGAQ